MSQLNLSNIKTVGFIPNFDPKKGYPEFGIKKESKPVKEINTAPIEVVEKVIPTWKKKFIKRMKWEKKKFKKSVGSNYKPVILTTNKLD